MTIEADLENISYLCGSTFQDISSEVYETILEVLVRRNLTCLDNIEVTYYGAHNEDICIYCACLDVKGF